MAMQIKFIVVVVVVVVVLLWHPVSRDSIRALNDEIQAYQALASSLGTSRNLQIQFVDIESLVSPLKSCAYSRHFVFST